MANILNEIARSAFSMIVWQRLFSNLLNALRAFRISIFYIYIVRKLNIKSHYFNHIIAIITTIFITIAKVDV